jgi:hypothetical protein
MAAADYEKLGLFYLGKQFDLDAGKRRDDLVLYDSRDLLTHAVIVGMTGSGKTGLGISLIEEAAIDGIPVLAIDPKGDLGNLLLTFPNLAASDFAPWIDAGEAQRHNTTVDPYAAETAQRWKAGLAEWDQDGSRIAKLKAAADVTVYTPGSRIGTPLAILGSLGPAAGEPGEDAQSDIATTAASLLGLAGLDDVQPHSREQALIAAILSSRQANTPADLRWLVQQIQRPSFDSIGVLDLETFFPARERQELALRFNSVLAAPGFDAWSAGEPLDAASLLFTPAGKPRIAIISVAHLDDSQRMLVVSLVLNAVLRWTRRQSGTSSLRALVYMDEVFGYMPPVANPSSKLPLLTLLKQARAFGVGLVLATQNPVDLDYKALSNTGTWFLGKLQTERDKARMLDGLEGVSSGLDRQSNRSRAVIAQGSRVPHAQRARAGADCIRDAMGVVVSARADGTRGTATIHARAGDEYRHDTTHRYRRRQRRRRPHRPRNPSFPQASRNTCCRATRAHLRNMRPCSTALRACSTPTRNAGSMSPAACKPSSRSPTVQFLWTGSGPRKRHSSPRASRNRVRAWQLRISRFRRPRSTRSDTPRGPRISRSG